VFHARLLLLQRHQLDMESLLSRLSRLKDGAWSASSPTRRNRPLWP
jgi:hypothetical protein